MNNFLWHAAVILPQRPCPQRASYRRKQRTRYSASGLTTFCYHGGQLLIRQAMLPWAWVLGLRRARQHPCCVREHPVCAVQALCGIARDRSTATLMSRCVRVEGEVLPRAPLPSLTGRGKRPVPMLPGWAVSPCRGSPGAGVVPRGASTRAREPGD